MVAHEGLQFHPEGWTELHVGIDRIYLVVGMILGKPVGIGFLVGGTDVANGIDLHSFPFRQFAEDDVGNGCDDGADGGWRDAVLFGDGLDEFVGGELLQISY